MVTVAHLTQYLLLKSEVNILNNLRFMEFQIFYFCKKHKGHFIKIFERKYAKDFCFIISICLLDTTLENFTFEAKIDLGGHRSFCKKV